ncbi:MAG: S9 family peptidase [Flavobacteriales bacterium]|nr:MAG: S9 family peptidase [Flavobacteriales bacterium]
MRTTIFGLSYCLLVHCLAQNNQAITTIPLKISNTDFFHPIHSDRLDTTKGNPLYSLDDIFNDPTLYPLPAKFDEFSPDGKHFLKRNQIGENWYLFLQNIETLDSVSVVFDSRWFDTIPSLGQYTLSGDGQFLVGQYEMQQVYRHSFTARCYVVDLHSKKITYIPGHIRYPSLSKDNKRLAYVKENNVYILNLSTKKETQITLDGSINQIINGAVDWVYEEEFSMSNGLRWSPSGNFLAFYHFDESKVKEFSMDLFPSGELYPKQEHWKYPKAGEDNARVDVLIYNTATGKTITAKTNSEKDQYLPRISWSQTDESLSIQRLNRWQNHWELFFCEPNTGKCELILEEKDSAYIDITDNLLFLENSTSFVYTSEKSGYNHLYLFDYKKKKEFAITKGNWEVIALLGYAAGNNTLVYSGTEQSTVEDHVYTVHLNGKEKTQISTPGFNYSVALAPQGLYYSESRSTFSAYPQMQHRIKKLGSHWARDIELNTTWSQKMAAFNLGAIEFRFFNSDSISTSYPDKDNAKKIIPLNAWIMNPPHFDPTEKHPVLMYVYGGPGINTVRNQYGGRNFLWHQYLASKGYIIVSVDNRGTGRRGAAFKKSTYLQLGKLETLDHTSVAKQLGMVPSVDANRIGIWGWSFGGYMSSSAIAKSGNVFSTAIAVAPVTHWKFYDNIYTERFLRKPSENPIGYESNSPINFTNGIKGNYLLIHGTADDNVHWQNSAAMINAMIKSGVSYDSEVYPNRNHGIGDRAAGIHLYKRMTRFILEKL